MTEVRSLAGRRFESVFRPDRSAVDGTPRFRISGSGVRRWPKDSATTRAIAEMLKQEGVEIKERASGSAGNANSYYLDATFLDGGLHATTGSYWFGEKGAWIHGCEAVARVARSHGIALPGARQCVRPPRLGKELLAAYVQTDFVVLHDAQNIIRIGKAPPVPVDELLVTNCIKSAIVITACNPFSTPLSEDVNHLRQRFLLQSLSESGLRWIAAEGRDPEGKWPAEASLLVLGPSAEQVAQLLVEFQQHAAVLVSHGAPTRLVLHPRHPAAPMTD